MFFVAQSFLLQANCLVITKMDHFASRDEQRTFSFTTTLTIFANIICLIFRNYWKAYSNVYVHACVLATVSSQGNIGFVHTGEVHFGPVLV